MTKEEKALRDQIRVAVPNPVMRRSVRGGRLRAGFRRWLIRRGSVSHNPLPEGRDLLDYWLGQLGNSGAARMLRVLAERYPRPTTAEDLGEAAELSAGSGTFSTYLGRLRTLELVTGSKSDLRASEELF